MLFQILNTKVWTNNLKISVVVRVLFVKKIVSITYKSPNIYLRLSLSLVRISNDLTG